MFNEATFGGMLLPSLGNINDYVAHIYRKYTDPDGNIDARWEFVNVPPKPDILAFYHLFFIYKSWPNYSYKYKIIVPKKIGIHSTEC